MSDDRTVAAWTESPFTSIERRGVKVEHRVVVESHDGVGVDVRHEVRCSEVGPGDGWVPATVLEARDHGIEKMESSSEWWQ